MRKHLANVTAAEDENEINLTPMLDVTFIMLIFFIVTASFIKATGIDANRPDQDQPQVVKEKGAILVILDNNDDIWIDGRIYDSASVRSIIERMSAEDPSRPVVIQTEPNSSTATLVGVMDASRQADVYNISIAAGS
jgi:biopolymer transport protein ExbD